MGELQEQENRTILVYATFPELAEAEEISRKLVDEKLIACANIFPGMISIYRWNEVVERGSEVVAIFKTRQALSGSVITRIEQLHTYDVPAIIVLPVSGGSESYRRWIDQMTGGEIAIADEARG
ncbi:MAG: divalent-cation tolerance protein CutA [Fimbriimonadaceae bacterium]|nr:divalent-cation tolerance protein CutA [Alphaproteobacteria bacterium]